MAPLTFEVLSSLYLNDLIQPAVLVRPLRSSDAAAYCNNTNWIHTAGILSSTHLQN